MPELAWDFFSWIGIWFTSSLITFALAAAVMTSNKRGRAE